MKVPDPAPQAAQGERGRLYIGLMSGTSLDGVDAALVEFARDAPRLIESNFIPYPEPLKRSLLALHDAGDNELDRASLLAIELSELYAQAALQLLGKSEARGAAVAAIGCHGQTVRHRPEAGYSIQLVNGALLAERTAHIVATDFRSRDLAAGGQGAPLVPAFHAVCFRDSAKTRSILNIGGIANLTFLPIKGSVAGFDTGPGNLLLDLWARRQLAQDFDRDGALAARGTFVTPLLASMMQDDYFLRPPPKSTGRDYFNERWLLRHGVDQLDAADAQATIAELTARTVADAVRRFCPGTSELFVCGGGAHNRDLMRRLASNLADLSVASTQQLGIDPDWVEAMAFAWLAKCALQREPANLPEATGAKGPRVLGAIYPA